VSGNGPVRNPKLAWREIEGEIVIISPEKSQVHELNETAALIWKHADGKSDAERMAARLAEEYDVALEAARADVTELLAQLEEKDLLLVARSRGSEGNG
jgi:coenzyme PQQ synthesis protein D (PqqD)